MKYKALAIKNWIINNLSPQAWSIIISRALPELLEINPNFSAYFVGMHTEWGEQEVKVIRWYLRKFFATDLPEDLLSENGGLDVNYMHLVSFDFFKNPRQSILNIKKSLLNILKF